MTIIRLPAASVILFCALEAVSGRPRQEQTAPPAVAPGAATAAIYVTAETKKGILIRDLKPEDITITEDKVPTKIEKVSCGRPEPLLVGVLLDVSGSRGIDPLLSSHYAALEAFLNRFLGENDGSYMIVFDDEPQKLSELLLNGPAISAAFDKLRKYQPHGSTALYDGIKEAAEAKFRGHSGRRILIVIGDWEDNSSHIRLEDAVRDAQNKAIKRGHVQAVYCAKRVAGSLGQT